MAAAVADFRPEQAAPEKLKKAGLEVFELRLEATPDVLSGLAAARRPGQVLIGFAAETGAETAVAYGRDKLARKGLDAVVVNDVAQAGIGFDATDNEVTIVTAGGEQAVPRADKAAIARAVLAVADGLLDRTAASPRRLGG
jgi:phosphopantothenoylcysteine decarboxylase/phosphopantothenate--cysteine ligase